MQHFFKDVLLYGQFKRLHKSKYTVQKVLNKTVVVVFIRTQQVFTTQHMSLLICRLYYWKNTYITTQSY